MLADEVTGVNFDSVKTFLENRLRKANMKISSDCVASQKISRYAGRTLTLEIYNIGCYIFRIDDTVELTASQDKPSRIDMYAGMDAETWYRIIG